MFQEVKAVLTHPEFRQTLEEASRLPVEQRAQALSLWLTRDALMTRGVSIPDSMSISTDDVDASDASTIDSAPIDTSTTSDTSTPTDTSVTEGALHIYSLSTKVCIPFLPCFTVFHRLHHH
jgi:hypothetical protein